MDVILAFYLLTFISVVVLSTIKEICEKREKEK